ncbi:DUF6308 family protein [Streptomyces chartreusis]|uniref:DUF6308 family protein n=1 Tax=Streptomyces chartreusis TaxID=1969 RepID=UPI00368C4D20
MPTSTNDQAGSHMIKPLLLEPVSQPAGAASFTGRRFEHLAGGGDRPAVANVVTADDLIELQTLSVTIPAQGALDVLEGRLGLQVSERAVRDPVSVSWCLWTRGGWVPPAARAECLAREMRVCPDASGRAIYGCIDAVVELLVRICAATAGCRRGTCRACLTR